MHLLISRTDAIGDVCLTLPAIGWLKSMFPHWRITMLVKAYAAPVAQSCHWLDEVFVLPEDLDKAQAATWLSTLNIDHMVHVFPNRLLAVAAKQAGISKRSGVVGRPFHWFNCTDMVWMSRAKSPHHEAYLNILLLSRILKLPAPGFLELREQLTHWGGLPLWNGTEQKTLANVILHPYSRGSGREWPIEHFAELAHRLVTLGYIPVVGGTAADAQMFNEVSALFPKETVNVMGQDSLIAYLQRINTAAGLVASGTGPLHMASLTGCPNTGLFPPRKNINSVRWGAIGPHSANLESSHPCQIDCSNKACACMASITPQQVELQLLNQINKASHLY